MAIRVDTDGLSQAARGFHEASAAVQDLHGRLSSALDQVAAAAANAHIGAGATSLHTGLTSALQALAEGSNRFGARVTQAAARYHVADTLADSTILDQAPTDRPTGVIPPSRATFGSEPEAATHEDEAEAVEQDEVHEGASRGAFAVAAMGGIAGERKKTGTVVSSGKSQAKSSDESKRMIGLAGERKKTGTAVSSGKSQAKSSDEDKRRR